MGVGNGYLWLWESLEMIGRMEKEGIKKSIAIHGHSSALGQHVFLECN